MKTQRPKLRNLRNASTPQNRRRRLRLQSLERRDLLAGDIGLTLAGVGEGEGENIQPSFTASDPPAVNEDAGEQFLNGFATFDPGAASESGQSALAYHVSDITNPDLFETLPAITVLGRLTYTPAANAYGTARFTVTVQDNGGMADGGIDTSAPQSFFLTINPVNDSPTITVGDTVTVSEDSSTATVNNFVTNFDAGPGEDGSQDGSTQGGSRVIHDEGSGGTANPFSNDNQSPTDLGTLASGDNIIHGFIESAKSVGNVDVFTITIGPDTQLDALLLDAFDGSGDQLAFLAVDDTNSFPYDADGLSNSNPNFDPNDFIGGMLFGSSHVGNTDGILGNLGSGFGSGFTPPLGPGTYTFYAQQLGPATTYSLRFQVSQTSDASSGQALAGYSVGQISDAGLFDVPPAIDALGTLSFTPAADAFGTVTFEVFAQDDGGTPNGGTDTSIGSTATITITPVNDAPTITTLSEVLSLEDNGSTTVADFVTSFDPGPNESGTSEQSNVLHDEGSDGTTNPLSTDNLNPTDLGELSLGSNTVHGYLEQASSTGNVDVFTFTVADGHEWSGLFVDEYNYPQTPSNPNERNAFLGINDADSFPYDTFQLDFNNNPFFDESTFLGGTIFGISDLASEGGGDDILPRAGRITGRRFTAPLPAGTYTIYNQQTGSAANRYTLDLRVTEASGQRPLEYTVANVTNPDLFTVAPTVDTAGKLSFTPADDAVGTTTFEISVRDDGGVASGGVDQSNTTTATLTLQGVNDPPSFQADDPPAVLRDSGDQFVIGWVTASNVGPADESNQSVLQYHVTDISAPALFESLPTVTPQGTLAYRLAPGAFGTVSFQVSVQDDGGTFQGGSDQSSPLTFSLVINDRVDFGDAPSGYPVLLADDGARHSTNSLFLGAGVGSELEGQPSGQADADDDDGVTTTINLIASIDQETTGFIDVTASEAGVLQAWIDFDQDGDWSDSGEQIATDLTIDPGNNRITFPIPAGSAAGTTYARFRISSETSLGVTGAASSGEVEDHAIVLLDAATPSNTTFSFNGPDLFVVAGTQQIVLRENGTDLWKAPSNAVDQLQIQGSFADQELVITVESGSTGVPAGIQLDGGAGIDTLRLSGATDLVDITAQGTLHLRNIERLDLADGLINVIRIDTGSFDNDNNAPLLFVTGDSGDQVELADPDQWQLGPTRTEGQIFIRTLRTTNGGPAVELVLPDAWRNIILPSDVNNNGVITAGDALVIINELARSTYSDATTGELVSAASLPQWPGVYYDQNGDGAVSALDALRIINELARASRDGEESEFVPPTQAIAASNPASTSDLAAIDQAFTQPAMSRNKPSKIASFEWAVAESQIPSVADFERNESQSQEAAFDEAITADF